MRNIRKKDFDNCVTCLIMGKWQNLTLRAFDRMLNKGLLYFDEGRGNWAKIC